MSAVAGWKSVAHLRFNPRHALLRWSPPVLQNATDYTVTTGFYNPTVPGTDANYVMPGSQRTSGLQVLGPRRAKIIGGKLNWNPASGTVAELFRDVSEHLYREGGHIIATRSGDAMGGSGNTAGTLAPDVTIQNMLVEGVNGDFDNVHADIYQLQHALHDLKIDKLTGTSSYQGIQIAPQYAIKGNVWLSRINLKYGSPFIDEFTQLIWLFTTQADFDNTSHKVYIDDVWIEPRGPTYDLRQCIRVVDGLNGEIGSDAISEYVWFPNYSQRIVSSITGLPAIVRRGPPPAGDFVTSTQVGIGYTAATHFQNC